MKKYDFILFEHTIAKNHEKDVEMIARLLIANGKKVAIANVYNEKECCKDNTIEHLSFAEDFPYRFLDVKDNKNIFTRFIRNRIIMFKYLNYLRYAINELSQYSNNIYIGSYDNDFSLRWLKRVSHDINIYLWGLRSYRLYEHKITPFSLVGFNSIFNRKYIKRQNVFLFVSDELIRDEFLKYGIPQDKLIIRPERTTESIIKPKNKDYSEPTIFLSIGSIRPDKRIELISRAFYQINSKKIKYYIAGRTSERDDYERVILGAIGKNDMIKRINKRLTDDEYEQYIINSDFLILADKKQPSCVTNGTMNEALLKGCPIIAPNYNPYKYYIEKYGVGILYDPNDIQTLISAILTATQLGAKKFEQELENYQNQFLHNSVAKDFCESLKL